MTIYIHLHIKDVVSISLNIFLLHLFLCFTKDLFIWLFPKVLDLINTQNRSYHNYVCILYKQKENIPSFSQVSMIMHCSNIGGAKLMYAKMYLLDISFLLLVIISHLFRKFNSIPCKMEPISL